LKKGCSNGRPFLFNLAGVKPLVNKKYLLEKFPGKGGWTFAKIPEILQDKKSHFGWVKVRGTIDGYEIRKYHLMPMGNGHLFLPVMLYPDNEPLEVPEEMLVCLEDEPKAMKFFKSLSESEQKFYIQYVYSAKKEETKIERLAKSINRLKNGLKLYQKEME
jgi:hypothetical protein